MRPSRTFDTRAEAEEFQAQKQAEFDRSPQGRRVAPKITLGEFIQEFTTLRTGPRGQRLKAASLEEARCSLERFAAFVGRDRRLVEITSAQVVKYFASLRDRGGKGDSQGKLAPATVNKAKRTLKAAFSVAVLQLGHLRENPFHGIRADRVAETTIRYVTPEEFAAVLAVCDTLPVTQALWWRTFLSVCYVAGLRYGEALHLTWADLDFAADTIRVCGKGDRPDTIAWTPKDYETRVIPVPAETMDLLARLQESTREGHAYVFLQAERLSLIKVAQEAGRWREGQAVINNFHRRFQVIVVKAVVEVPSLLDREGKPTVSIHDLRRSAITNWSKAANMQTVMKMAGHSNIETTQRYYAAATEDQLALIRQASRDALRVAPLRQTDPKLTPKADLGFSTRAESSTKSLSSKTLRP
jgi:integrase